MLELKGKKLTQHEIAETRHFVYNVYARELKWLPVPDNPSNWIVKEDKQGKYFSDIFDETAIWFGVFAGKEQAAAGRFIKPINNKLEVELYQDIPEIYRSKQLRRVEINRLTVKTKYNNSPALLVLLQTMYEYIEENSIDIVITGVPQATVDFARLIGLKDFEPPLHFFYSKDDPTGATVMYRDCRDKSELKQQIDQLSMEAVKAFKFFVEDV